MTSPISAADLDRARDITERLRGAVGSKVVGQRDLVQALLIALVAGGHVLLESVPGLAKTLSASALASAVSGSFARVQCTPDLLPSDIIGTQVFDAQRGEFATRLGPVHVNFVLLDEINRSSAKTQSAMLEAMQERQTSIGGVSYRLPEPFMVLATQNPIEEEGTYVLPQAQMDRFLLKEIISYPSATEELEMLERLEQGALDRRDVAAVASLSEISWLQELARQVYVDQSIKRYLIELVTVTRHPERYLGSDQARYVEYGASPRGVIAFVLASRVHALLHGRSAVLPEDVHALRYSVLRHRLLLTFEAMADRVRAEDLIDAAFAVVPTP